ncbi:MAG: hypothetical protein WDW36_006270 [Sanguina aurantia]
MSPTIASHNASSLANLTSAPSTPSASPLATTTPHNSRTPSTLPALNRFGRAMNSAPITPRPTRNTIAHFVQRRRSSSSEHVISHGCVNNAAFTTARGCPAQDPTQGVGTGGERGGSQRQQAWVQEDKGLDGGAVQLEAARAGVEFRADGRRGKREEGWV